jgi:hypothetical protein
LKIDQHIPLVLFLAVLILHIPGLFFFENYDADAYSRIYIAQLFVDHPIFFTEGIWAPLHYYFTALSLWIIPDQVYGPAIFHVLVGSLSVIPLYKLVMTIFKNKHAAIITALMVVLAPVVFRNSYHALSGGPALFLIAWAMFHVVKIQFDDGTWKNALWAGLFMTLAAGMRYEAWMFMAFFALIIAATNLKKAFIFSAVAGIFPLFWMIGNYQAHGDPFYFLEGARIWNQVMEGNNDVLNPSILASRRLFFSYSLMLNLLPWVVLPAIVFPILAVKNKQVNWRFLLWLGVALIVLIVFTIKAVAGTLFTQHRFTGLLILLFAPLVASIFSVGSKRWLFPAGLASIVISLCLSFCWNEIKLEGWFPKGETREALTWIRERTANQMKAIPRQSRRDASQLLVELKATKTEKDGLIIDFIGWDQTYFIALESRLRRDELQIVPGAANEPVDLNRLSEYIYRRNCPSGFLVFSEKSKLSPFIDQGAISLSDSTFLTLRASSAHGKLFLYRYKLIKTPKSTALPD